MSSAIPSRFQAPPTPKKPMSPAEQVGKSPEASRPVAVASSTSYQAPRPVAAPSRTSPPSTSYQAPRPTASSSRTPLSSTSYLPKLPVQPRFRLSDIVSDSEKEHETEEEPSLLLGTDGHAAAVNLLSRERVERAGNDSSSSDVPTPPRASRSPRKARKTADRPAPATQPDRTSHGETRFTPPRKPVRDNVCDSAKRSPRRPTSASRPSTVPSSNQSGARVTLHLKPSEDAPASVEKVKQTPQHPSPPRHAAPSSIRPKTSTPPRQPIPDNATNSAKKTKSPARPPTSASQPNGTVPSSSQSGARVTLRLKPRGDMPDSVEKAREAKETPRQPTSASPPCHTAPPRDHSETRFVVPRLERLDDVPESVKEANNTPVRPTSETRFIVPRLKEANNTPERPTSETRFVVPRLERPDDVPEEANSAPERPTSANHSASSNNHSETRFIVPRLEPHLDDVPKSVEEAADNPPERPTSASRSIPSSVVSETRFTVPRLEPLEKVSNSAVTSPEPSTSSSQSSGTTSEVINLVSDSHSKASGQGTDHAKGSASIGGPTHGPSRPKKGLPLPRRTAKKSAAHAPRPVSQPDRTVPSSNQAETQSVPPRQPVPSEAADSAKNAKSPDRPTSASQPSHTAPPSSHSPSRFLDIVSDSEPDSETDEALTRGGTDVSAEAVPGGKHRDGSSEKINESRTIHPGPAPPPNNSPTRPRARPIVSANRPTQPSFDVSRPAFSSSSTRPVTLVWLFRDV
jgi:hypothetical protein